MHYTRSPVPDQISPDGLGVSAVKVLYTRLVKRALVVVLDVVDDTEGPCSCSNLLLQLSRGSGAAEGSAMC